MVEKEKVKLKGIKKQISRMLQLLGKKYLVYKTNA